MGTQKSHFAYRLAWDNSFSERIPFLPLHRRDLVSAEEGNKTFVGDNKSRINWKKFEVMGEVVLGIQRSQKTPYSHMHRYADIQRLILDIKLGNDEEVSNPFFFFFFFIIISGLWINANRNYRNYILAVCMLSLLVAVIPVERSSAGYDLNL